jgi:dTDP-4-amino-4,6-dideoxygalactose transaminase
VPLHQQKCFEYVKSDSKTLKNSEQLAGEVLSIPIFPELSDEQRKRAVEIIKKFFSS